MTWRAISFTPYLITSVNMAYQNNLSNKTIILHTLAESLRPVVVQ